MVVIVITVSWSVCLLILQILRFNRLGASAFDLGIFQQAVWLMSQGKTPFVTVRGMHILGDHFTPILYLLAVPYRFWAHPFWLFLAQTIALAAGAFPLYRLTMRTTQHEWAAVLVVIGYLLHPALFTMLLFDFHPVLLSVPFVLWAMDAIESGRVVHFIVGACCAALCRQDVAIPLAGISMYGIFVRKRHWAWGGLIFSFVWFSITMKIMTYLSNTEQSAYLSLYDQWGKTLTSIIWGIITHPIEVIKSLTLCHGYVQTPGIYPLLLVVPFALFPLLAPEVLVWGLPSYALIALSERPVMREIGYQYGALIVPWLAFASISTWERLLRWGKHLAVSLQRRWEVTLALTWINCLALGTCHYGSPVIQRFMLSTLPPEEARAIMAFLRKHIPPDASVTAPSNLVPLLAHREHIYLFPNPFYQVVFGPSVNAVKQQMKPQSFHITAQQFYQRIKSAPVDFIVLRKQTNTQPLQLETYETIAIYLLSCPEYGVIARKGNTIILKHKADFAHGLYILGVNVRQIREGPKQITAAVSAIWRQLQE
ncbi:hypothetical protein HRbin17_00826 [bacterium HR17]|uniref:DUF2079 domain-containing protein n=1 Tax=Candidatus Fervidibacter japonicus TaxID=2035412 RepID=A0A2H5XAY6_9BACT|nr:hypothetical protein HRbin17_00826 [bacterium HR17]